MTTYDVAAVNRRLADLLPGMREECGCKSSGIVGVTKLVKMVSGVPSGFDGCGYCGGTRGTLDWGHSYKQPEDVPTEYRGRGWVPAPLAGQDIDVGRLIKAIQAARFGVTYSIVKGMEWYVSNNATGRGKFDPDLAVAFLKAVGEWEIANA